MNQESHTSGAEVERETVWCEAHGGLSNPHFEQPDCLYPHFTDLKTRARMNDAARDPNPAEHGPVEASDGECLCGVVMVDADHADAATLLDAHIYEADQADGPGRDPDGWLGPLPADDGPGRDQHGTHERRDRLTREQAMDAIAEFATEMTGPAVSVEHVGLPSPDAHAVATSRRTPVDMNARYADATTCECGALIEQMESTVGYSYWAHVKRMRISYDHPAVPDRRASHEGPTVSALVGERFQGGER